VEAWDVAERQKLSEVSADSEAAATHFSQVLFVHLVGAKNLLAMDSNG